MVNIKCSVPLNIDFVFAHCSYFIHAFCSLTFKWILVQLTCIHIGKVLCWTYCVQFVFGSHTSPVIIILWYIICELCYSCRHRLLLEIMCEMDIWVYFFSFLFFFF